MSTGAHPLPQRTHWPRRWFFLLLVGLVAVAGIGVGINRASFSGETQYCVAARAVRRAGHRRPLRHLRRAREPGGAEWAHDRAQRRRLARVSGSRPERTRLPGSPGVRETPPPSRRSPGAGSRAC